MIQKLSKHGDKLALVIDPSVLEQLGIDENTSLEISTDGETLTVAPVRDEQRRQRFEQALKSTNERYGKALKRLAE
jgi:antitoxin MazE